MNRNIVLQEELNDDKEKQRNFWKGLLGPLVGSLVALTIHNDGTEWPAYYEDDADSSSIQYLPSQGYDAHETPHVFEHLETISARDPRVGLGNSGTIHHLKARRLRLQE